MGEARHADWTRGKGGASKMSQRNRTKPLPAVRGQYNINGYDVWIGGQLVYAAGNHVQDSTQYAA